MNFYTAIFHPAKQPKLSKEQRDALKAKYKNGKWQLEVDALSRDSGVLIADTYFLLSQGATVSTTITYE